MQLNHFSKLVAGFAAGFVLCGCASGPQSQHMGYEPAGVNAGPAYVVVGQGPDGLRQVARAAQAQEGYDGGYQGAYQRAPSQGGRYGAGYQGSRPQPRFAYGYRDPRQAQQQEQRSLMGLVGGAAVGNAISHGNPRAMAAGAVIGQAAGRHGDPCSEANGGTALGALAGYALGNKIGGGSGRKVASVLGAVAGANAGGDMARPGPRCR
jgi:hypothetical protein